MRSFCILLAILILCVMYKELNDFTNKDRLKLITLNEKDKRLQCEGNYSGTEIYMTINESSTTFDQLNPFSCYYISSKDIIYHFTVRSLTRNYNDDILFTINCTAFYFRKLLTELINCKLDSDIYYLRLKWFYLGKYLTKAKYSHLVHVPTVKKTKCSLLIIMLLFMCGDTGASINPGPISQLDLNVCEVSDDRYLNDIDPDINYFNESEINSSYFQSYTIDEFKERTFDSQLNFNIMHHNCRSILSKDKLDYYEYFLDMLGDPFDIIGLTETWLNVNTANSLIFKDFNYSHVYETRPLEKTSDCKNEGGGVSLFIRDHIAFKKRNDLSVFTPYLELLFVEINLHNRVYLIGVAYRVPNTKFSLFNDEINAILEPLKNKYHIILMGDFNVCLMKENSNKNLFKNTMQTNSLFPTITEPTRVCSIERDGQSTITESLIDNIFVNENLACSSGLIYSDISDHYPIFVSIPLISTPKNTESVEIKYRPIDEFRIRKFKFAVANNPIFKSVMSMHSADVAFTTFINSFNQLYDKYFTIFTKKITRKTLLKPWITNEMVEQIKYKHALARLYNKGRIDKTSYTDFKNKLTKVLRQAKIEYFANEFSKKEGDIKGTWQVINKSIKNRSKNKNVVIKENGHIVNKKDLPNKFIDYFISIPHNLISKVRSVDVDISFFLKNRSCKTFFLMPIINKDIESVIKNLKYNNGIHNVSTVVLKEIMSEISEPLSYIFNLCTSQGYFPDELKSGCITPIYKKGEHNNIENYRPVCSLSQFSKIFEKIIYNQMTNYIDKNNIITNSQYGFRANKSTESALIELVDYVHKGLTNKSNIGAVFMDLSKAFDVMSHNILKIKLEHYGFRGSFLEFLMSF